MIEPTIDQRLDRIERLVRTVLDRDRDLAEAREQAKTAYRRGWRAGWFSGKRGSTCDPDAALERRRNVA